jgi:hypothetical protein
LYWEWEEDDCPEIYQKFLRCRNLARGGRGKPLNPKCIPSRLQERKIVNPTFSEKQFLKYSLIEKQFHSVLVEWMGLSFKIVLSKTTFKTTKVGS